MAASFEQPSSGCSQLLVISYEQRLFEQNDTPDSVSALLGDL
jgi:hypothetical protein